MPVSQNAIFVAKSFDRYTAVRLVKEFPMRKYLVSVIVVAGIVLALCASAARLPLADSVNEAKAKKGTGIRIIEAAYGDENSHKTCTPELSLC